VLAVLVLDIEQQGQSGQSFPIVGTVGKVVGEMG